MLLRFSLVIFWRITPFYCRYLPINLSTIISGWVFDQTGTYLYTFLLAGISIMSSGAILYPIPCLKGLKTNALLFTRPSSQTQPEPVWRQWPWQGHQRKKFTLGDAKLKCNRNAMEMQWHRVDNRTWNEWFTCWKSLCEDFKKDFWKSSESPP